MEKKRFQVFVSSTFEDLREERQAAVEAILKAGHIPAGMELFTAGSESQLEVIRDWIRSSDIYMLILGARYGSIEPTSGLSYTEVEFDYASELGKPLFAVVISDDGREAKIKSALGTKAVELVNGLKYEAFRRKVTGRMCAFFETSKDIKLAVFETMPQLSKTEGLIGWVPANETVPTANLTNELTSALQENRRLSLAIGDLTARIELERKAAEGDCFQELVSILGQWKVTLENPPFPHVETTSVLHAALKYQAALAYGVTDQGNDEIGLFLIAQVAAVLMGFGLAEGGAVPPGASWQRIKLSKSGVDFLTRVRVSAERKTKLLKRNAEPKASG